MSLQFYLFSNLNYFSIYIESHNELLADLKSICRYFSEHSSIEYLSQMKPLNRLSGPDFESSSSTSERISSYFAAHKETLFTRESDIPDWVHDRFLDSRFLKRLVPILKARFEIFRPLVDDFSLDDSSYECIFTLTQYIYGILRTSEEDRKPVTIFFRKGKFEC